MNTANINARVAKLGGRHVPFSTSRYEAIGFIYDCDMMTAQNIVNRIGETMGIGNDPIIVLKTASPLQICEGILAELEPATTQTQQTT